MVTRPLGYASIEEFCGHLGIPRLREADVPAVLTALRSAEESVNAYCGGRRFLPVQAKLVGALDSSATTAVLSPSADLMTDSGDLLIDDEVVEYASVELTSAGRVVELTRGLWGTQAASHADAAFGYQIQAELASRTGGTVPTADDFIALHRIWVLATVSPYPQWSILNPGLYAASPAGKPPYSSVAGMAPFRRAGQYRIAATWGFSRMVPYPVKTAVLRVAEDFWRRRGTSAAVIERQRTDSSLVQYRDPTLMASDVQAMLSPYKRRRV